jgi:nuclear pore complex protein Nup133
LEDLREPIIKDNLLDDEILQENLDKNRLDQWFKAACRAGKSAYMQEKRRGSSAQVESGDEEAVRKAAEAEAEASGVESDTVNGVDQSKDVQMQES